MNDTTILFVDGGDITIAQATSDGDEDAPPEPTMQRPHRLHLAILAQLAALGCSGPAAPAAAPVVTAPATPPTDPVAAPATPPPAATTFPAPTKIGDTCSHAVPCPPGLNCQLGFDGAKFSETGSCIDRPPVYEGRPLVTDGAIHRAALVASPGTRDEVVAISDNALAATLAQAAREEHASIAAFGRTLLALLHLGAPTSLVQATQAALADEIRHADDVLAAAIAHGAPPATFGPLTEATASFSGDIAAVLLDDVLTGGCIGETLAAFRAEARAQLHPSIRELCLRIAGDEARHAALAFATARFLVEQRPGLRAIVDDALAHLCRSGSAEDVALVLPVWRAAFGEPA